jgi:hypothetical protein
MMTKKLFDETGGFDESFPVCEDYDLWLRIALDHPVPLIAAQLVIKRGGHSDQLSHSLWGMDRYRVAALQKLLRAGVSGEKRAWVVDVLARGARKRGKESEARAYEAMPGEFVQEMEDVGAGDSRVRQGEGISPANIGAVARLGAAG